MKLLFESLDALLGELRDRRVEIVRISPALEVETTARTWGLPHLVSRVLVTAALDETSWAEWRLWIGQAPVEPGQSEFDLPLALRDRRDGALAEISRRVDDAGFRIREGIVTHDRGAMDTFRR